MDKLRKKFAASASDPSSPTEDVQGRHRDSSPDTSNQSKRPFDPLGEDLLREEAQRRRPSGMFPIERSDDEKHGKGKSIKFEANLSF